jgi:hypothetical protein
MSQEINFLVVACRVGIKEKCTSGSYVFAMPTQLLTKLEHKVTIPISPHHRGEAFQDFILIDD